MDWKGLVKSVAPVLGTALGGPLSGTAIKVLADKFLGNPDATESDIAEAILSASPEKLAEIKKIDADFKVQMRQLDIDVYKYETQDRDSARNLFKVNIWPQIILSTVYSVGYFYVLVGLISGDLTIPEDNKDLLLPLLGILTAAQTQIFNFWLGSSFGSKEKTVQLQGRAK